MKEIRMDFDIYEKELKEARLRGAGFKRSTVHALNELLIAVLGENRTNIYGAKTKLTEIINELQSNGEKVQNDL